MDEDEILAAIKAAVIERFGPDDGPRLSWEEPGKALLASVEQLHRRGLHPLFEDDSVRVVMFARVSEIREVAARTSPEYAQASDGAIVEAWVGMFPVGVPVDLDIDGVPELVVLHTRIRDDVRKAVGA